MKGNRMTGRLLCVCLLLVVLLIPAQAKTVTVTPLTDFVYELLPSGNVLLSQYVGQGSTVVVPGTYTVEQTERTVELASKSVFAKNTSISSVTLLPGVLFQNNAMEYLFYGCEGLKSIDLSGLETGSVTTMKAMLSGCKKLTQLTGYENWDTDSLKSIAYMFDGTASLQAVDLSNWTLSRIENTAWCFQNCAASKILLPDDLAVISAGFLNHAANYAGSSFTIPSGVKTIGYAHTIYDFATKDFTEFRVAEGNESYKAVDGILYSADGTQLLAIPRGKTFEDGVFQIPEGVTFLGELSFSRNQNIKTVVLPNSYALKYIPLNDPAYITFEDTGNLNAGLNLNIAIYCYTGITAYQVKADNPNYQSLDGILYSKDMTALVAVPTRYEGYIRIPEGVTDWQSRAMWCAGDSVAAMMKNCSGVYIPASMTNIGLDQVDKLNRIKTRVPQFTITVSSDNPLYYVDDDGKLMKKPLLTDMEITLEATSVLYDGTEKTPKPVIRHNGKTLSEGEDYTVAYANNIHAGTAWLQITALEDQYGTTECTFTIEPAVPEYTLPENLTVVYGNPLNTRSLPEGFSWAEPDLIPGDVGQYTCLLDYTKNDPNYRDVKNIPVTVTVTPKRLKADNFLLGAWYPWTGTDAAPELTVLDGETEIPKDAYRVTYQNNTGFGKATAVVEDCPGGNYTVSGSKQFWIVPGPGLLTACLTLLWCATTGRHCLPKRTAVRLKPRRKNR